MRYRPGVRHERIGRVHGRTATASRPWSAAGASADDHRHADWRRRPAIDRDVYRRRESSRGREDMRYVLTERLRAAAIVEAPQEDVSAAAERILPNVDFEGHGLRSAAGLAASGAT